MSDWTPPAALVEAVALVIDEVLNPPHLTAYEGADRIMRIALPLGEVVNVLRKVRGVIAGPHPAEPKYIYVAEETLVREIDSVIARLTECGSDWTLSQLVNEGAAETAG